MVEVEGGGQEFSKKLPRRGWEETEGLQTLLEDFDGVEVLIFMKLVEEWQKQIRLMAECHKPDDVVGGQKLLLHFEILLKDAGDFLGHGIRAVDVIKVDRHQAQELLLVPEPLILLPLFLGDEVHLAALVGVIEIVFYPYLILQAVVEGQQPAFFLGFDEVADEGNEQLG